MTKAKAAGSLTVKRIEDAVCPSGQTEIRLWDRITPGLLVRVRATGGKSYALRYRAGRGRAAPSRVYTIGPCDRMSLADARRIARAKLLEVQNGADPAAVRALASADELHRERSRFARLLDAYDQDLERRKVAKRREIVSLLRREGLEALGDVDLRTLDRPSVLKRIREIEASGRRGAAVDFRGKFAVFLG
jgi:hypothetical protein